ncbi:MAG: dihydrofolate reductase family protein [Hyphomicrobiales bacterium]|nr:dihydrofolate reductase family protein [Hyphomicrobiales bacterium]MDE2018006.1 dihydrofolate reductase family protein [Hyphomicrobiales bacterium]
MSKLRVQSFSVSLDGFGAGPEQGPADPMGKGAMALHQWVFPTRTFRRMHDGDADGSTGVDDGFAARGFEGLGAWILGRNMFGPVRGPWPDESWRGWWGEEPPYHVPVFVLTHHARAPLEMKGGTTFHFVTDGFGTALARAKEAAGGKDVRLGGGVATLREGLARRAVDEMHLAFAPVALGKGEAVFAGLDLPALGYRVVGRVEGEGATHVTFAKAG